MRREQPANVPDGDLEERGGTAPARMQPVRVRILLLGARHHSCGSAAPHAHLLNESPSSTQSRALSNSSFMPIILHDGHAHAGSWGMRSHM